MSDQEYDSLDDLLNDDDKEEISSDTKQREDNTSFQGAIDNTLTRLNGLKLTPPGEEEGKEQEDGLNDLIRMMQTKTIFYPEAVKCRDELVQWLSEHQQQGDDDMYNDRERQLKNLNERISIYERADYSDDKYLDELTELSFAMVQIPNQFVPGKGANDDDGAEISTDDFVKEIGMEMLDRAVAYDSLRQHRDELAALVGGEQATEAQTKEKLVYDEILELYDRGDYREKKEEYTHRILALLEQTQIQAHPDEDLSQDLWQALEGLGKGTTQEPETMLQELQEGCPVQ